MPLYFYQAFTKDGKKTSGYLDAPSSVSVKEQLIRQGLFPTTISSAKEESRIPWYKRLFARPIKLKDKINLTRQLAVMLKAGIPLLQSVELLAEQFTGTMHTILIGIKDDLKEGVSFANALSKYPHVFDTIYVQLVRAGEASGKLEPILDRLVIFYERRQEIQKRVRSAMTYPIIQLVVIISVVVFLLTAVVPRMVQAFSSRNQKLPKATRIIIALSNFFKSYFIVIIITLIAIYVLYRYIKSTVKGARSIDALKLKIPFIKYFTRVNAVVQFCQTLGLLIGSGVNLSESLDIVVSIVDNKVLADTLNEARDKIIKQGKIAQYLKQTNLFPPLAIYMISTGEESGQLDGMLTTVANNYEEELGVITDKLTTSLGPIMLVGMAIIVGFIIVAIAMPIIEMTKKSVELM
jgi:type II secretory pathway component PulF